MENYGNHDKSQQFVRNAIIKRKKIISVSKKAQTDMFKQRCQTSFLYVY